MSKTVLRHAEYSDVPELKELWAEVFGDEAEYIDLFFDRMFRPEDYVLLCGRDGGGSESILSMASLLPVDLVSDGERFPVSYLYGMATRPSEQGNGFGLKLLKHAAEYCKSIGKAGIALQPADRGLLRFYKKAGYLPAFTGSSNPSCYIDYPQYFLDFAAEAGYTVPAEEEPERSVPGVFLSFDPQLKPEKAYLAYPLD
jgi:GNAT superfamily N-acetyltransferase